MNSWVNSIKFKYLLAFSLISLSFLCFSGFAFFEISKNIVIGNESKKIFLVTFPLLIILMTGLWIYRISDSIDKTFFISKRIIQDIANGNYSEKVEINQKDKCGQLLFSLANLQYTLREDKSIKEINKSQFDLESVFQLLSYSNYLVVDDNFCIKFIGDELIQKINNIKKLEPFGFNNQIELNEVIGKDFRQLFIEFDDRKKKNSTVINLQDSSFLIECMLTECIPISEDVKIRLIEWNIESKDKVISDDDGKIGYINELYKDILIKSEVCAIFFDVDDEISFITEGAKKFILENELDIQEYFPNTYSGELLGKKIDQIIPIYTQQLKISNALRKENNLRVELDKKLIELDITPHIKSHQYYGSVLEFKDVTDKSISKNKDVGLDFIDQAIIHSVNNSSLGIMILDDTDKIIFANKSLKSILSYNLNISPNESLPKYARYIKKIDLDEVFNENIVHTLKELNHNDSLNIEVFNKKFRLQISIIENVEQSRQIKAIEWEEIIYKDGMIEEQIEGIKDIELFSKSIDYIPKPLLVVDDKMVITYLNHQFNKTFTSIEEDVRKYFPHFRVNELIGEHVDIFRAFSEMERNEILISNNINGKNIKIGMYFFRMVFLPILNNEGTKFGAIVEVEDKTQIIKYENEIVRFLTDFKNQGCKEKLSICVNDGFLFEISKKINAIYDEIEVVHQSFQTIHGNAKDKEIGIFSLKNKTNECINKFNDVSMKSVFLAEKIIDFHEMNKKLISNEYEYIQNLPLSEKKDAGLIEKDVISIRDLDIFASKFLNLIYESYSAINLISLNVCLETTRSNLNNPYLKQCNKNLRELSKRLYKTYNDVSSFVSKSKVLSNNEKNIDSTDSSAINKSENFIDINELFKCLRIIDNEYIVHHSKEVIEMLKLDYETSNHESKNYIHDSVPIKESEHESGWDDF